MPQNAEFKKIINDIKVERNLKQVDVAKMLEISNPYLSAVMNGKYPLTDSLIDKLYEVFNIKFHMGDDEDVSKNEVSPVNYEHYIPVRVVSSIARAGFSEAYYADEYLDDMPIIYIHSDKVHKGNYLAFEVSGDSMEPDYVNGEILICREIPRHLWQYKLHIDDWDFVIAHGTQGIMIKEIISHNVETGDIVCHSINTDMHPDFTLNLGEVTRLFNIVETHRPRKGKRRVRDYMGLD